MSRNDLLMDMVRHGLLIETGVRGVYGRGPEFEDTVERVDRLVGTTPKRSAASASPSA